MISLFVVTIVKKMRCSNECIYKMSSIEQLIAKLCGGAGSDKCGIKARTGGRREKIKTLGGSGSQQQLLRLSQN
jgi:hypothetical protein